MATHSADFATHPLHVSTHTAANMVRGSLTLLGRVLFALIFLLAGPQHFTDTEINSAVAACVPMAKILVPAAGILAFIGALSVLLGYRAKIGAWLLVIFLVPVTLVMHNFWAASDPATHQLQTIMFLKNISILGGALLITQFGAGEWSLDSHRTARHG